MANTNFINECRNRANANRLGKIIIDGITLPITNSDNLQSFEIDSGCYVDGNIIGSVYAKCLKANFIAEQNNLVDKSIQAKIGVKYANMSTEYINMGKYTIKRPTNEITANMSQIMAYSDLYTNLDSEYICNIDYSAGNKTVSDLYIDVCNQLGLIPVTTTFINSTIPVTANPFTNGEKNRMVLRTIAKISCSFADIDNDTNKIDLRWLSSSKTPDYTFYKNDYSSVEGGQVICGPINCLIIKNSQVDDENVTIKDDESIEANGEHSIIISEDYILHNAELRQQAITSIWNRVKDMKYVDCKLTTYYGKPFLKLGDYIRIYTSETEYFDTYVLKHNFTYDGSFTSVIESPALTEQEIKTKQKIGLGEKLRNTQIDVNKQLGIITSKVDETNTKIEDITTTTQTSTGGNSLYLKEALESNALEYSIDGKCEQDVTVQGKNILDTPKALSQTISGLTCEVNDDGSIKLTGTTTGWPSIIAYLPTPIVLDGTYTLSVKTVGSTIKDSSQVLLLTDDDANSGLDPIIVGDTTQSKTKTFSNKVISKIKIYANKGFTFDSVVYLQLEKNPTATNWEQFVPNSPSPDYPSEIKTINGIRNLLNLNVPTSTTNGITCTNNNDGSITINGHTTKAFRYYLTNDNITFEKGKKYTISAKILSGSCTNYSHSVPWAFMFIADFNNNATMTYINSTTKEIERTFDGSNASAKPNLWFGWNSSTTENDAVFNDLRVQFMVEEGDIKHSYVPHGTYEKINVTGKNIFNIQKWLNTTFAVVNGNLNSKTSNSISLTSTADDCYTQTFGMSTITNKTNIDNFGFEINANTDYTFYTKKSDTIGGTNFVFYFDKDYKYISLKSNNSITNENFLNFTTPPNAKYICFRLGINGPGHTVEFSNIMLLKGTITTTPDYEPYKEKEILIDLAKENLFNINDFVSKNSDYYSIQENKLICDVIDLRTGTSFEYYQFVKGTYTIRTTNNCSIRIFADNSGSAIVSANDTNKLTFTISANRGLFFKFFNSTVPSEIGSVYIYKGFYDSYEPNSINDIKDKLETVNSVVDIQKKIVKIILDGVNYKFASKTGTSSQNIYLLDVSNFKNITDQSQLPNVMSTHFKVVAYSSMGSNETCITASKYKKDSLYFKFGTDSSLTTVALANQFLQEKYSSDSPIVVYYELATPETITLPNADIPLYEEINHVTLVEDLETTTSIKYLRKTPISGEYALNQDLNKTNSNLADTNNQLNQTQSDIDNTNTNLNNNYYNKEQVDSINSNTTQNITQIRNTMEQNITSTNATISKIQEEITNGVSKVITTTGAFDENGLNISKSGQPMSSTLDWEGLEVVRDKGKSTESKVLIVRPDKVESENMKVRTYLTQEPIRNEKCVSISDGKSVGYGTYWIGEE